MASIPYPFAFRGKAATSALTFDLYAGPKAKEILTEASYAACLDAASKLEGEAWSLIAVEGRTVTVVAVYDPDGIEDEGDPDEETPDPTEEE